MAGQSNILKFILQMQDQATQVLQQHGAAVTQVGSQVTATSASFGKFGDAIKDAAEALAGFAATALTVKESISDFAALEAQMYKTSQTTHIVGDGLKDLTESVISMSAKLGVIPTEKLAHLEQTAGLLGARSKSDVEAFAEAMGKLSTAVDIGDDGPQQIGRLLTITGEGIGQVQHFGDTLVSMANSTKASSQELVAFAASLAVSTSQFKFSSDQLLGLGAALATLNQNPQTAALNLGMTLQQLNVAATQGGHAINELTGYLGTTREEFTKLLQTDPQKAFTDLLETLHELNKTTAGQAKAHNLLEAFGITGQEQIQLLNTLAKSVDLVESKFEHAQDNAANAGASDNAFEGYRKLTEANLAALGNAFTNFKNELGADLAPVFNVVVEGLTAIIDAGTKVLQFFGHGVFGQAFAWVITLGPALLTAAAAFRTFAAAAALFGVSFTGIFSGLAGITTAILPIIAEVLASISAALFAGILAIGELLAGPPGWVLLVASVGALLYAGFKPEIDGFFENASSYFTQKIAELKANLKWSDIFDLKVNGKSVLYGDKGASNVFGSGFEPSDAQLKAITDGANGLKQLPKVSYDDLGRDRSAHGDALNDQQYPTGPAQSDIDKGMRGLSLKGDLQLDPAQVQAAADAASKNLKIKPGNTGAIDLLSTEQQGQLNALSPQAAAANAYKKAVEQFNTLKDNLTTSGATQDPAIQAQLDQAQKLLDLKKQQLDPLFQQTQEMKKQADAAAALTKDDQNQLQIQQAIADFAQKNGGATDEQKRTITNNLQAVQQAQTDAAYANQNRTLGQQLETAQAITQTQRDQLDIAQQLSNFLRANGSASADQLAHQRDMLEALQAQQNFNNLKGQLDPIGQAAIKYTDDLNVLQLALQKGIITQQQFNQMAAQLKFNADAANPIKSMVADMQHQLDLTKLTTEQAQIQDQVYQKIQQLQQQGVPITQQTKDAVTQYVTAMQTLATDGNNGFAQWADSVKDFGSALADVEKNGVQSFADSLVDAISGGKNAFQGFIQNIGKQLLTLGINQLLKNAIGSTGLGSIFGTGKAPAQASAQDALNKIASLNTITAATATVNATTVSINGAGVGPGGVTSSPLPDVGGGGTGGMTGSEYTAIKPGKISATVADALQKASAYSGESYADLYATASIESKFDPNANAHNNAQAKGLFQFVPSTGKDFGLTYGEGGSVYDPYKSAMAGAQLMQQNENALAKYGFNDPSGSQLYLAHQQGAAGAAGLLNNPNMQAYQALQQYTHLSDSQAMAHISQNGGDPTASAEQFTNMWKQKFDGLASQAQGAADKVQQSGDKIKDSTDQQTQATVQGAQQQAGAAQQAGQAAQQATPAIQQAAAATQKQGSAAQQAAPQIQSAGQKTQQVGPAMQGAAQGAGQVTPNLQGAGSAFSGMLGPLLSVVPGLGQFSGVIQQLLSSLFSGLGGGGGGGGGGNILGGLLGAIGLHGGGEVGVSRPAFVRTVSAGMFASAPRYHVGLNNDEFAAILQKNERVLTSKQNKKAMEQLGSLSKDPAIATPRRGGAVPVSNQIVVNVSANGSSGDQQKDDQHQREMAKKTSAAVDQAMTDWTINQQRPGGLLYQGKTS